MKTKDTGFKNEYSVYVGDLDVSVTDDDIYKLFQPKYSSVLAANVIMDPLTRKSKKYGFIRFSNEFESHQAI